MGLAAHGCRVGGACWIRVLRQQDEVDSRRDWSEWRRQALAEAVRVACADSRPERRRLRRSSTHGTPEDPSCLRKCELVTTDVGPSVFSAIILQILGPITAKTALFAVILLKFDRLTAVLPAMASGFPWGKSVRYRYNEKRPSEFPDCTG